jgi:Baseplate J-like protein
MSCGATPCSCGCCAGVENATPRSVLNPPGQPSLNWRVGEWSSFRESLFASLAQDPILRNLRTRDLSDPAIALCDAESVMLDVLTFYTERIANEGYLATATERASLAAMAREIGYVPAPGVAASCDLRFFLDETPGAPKSTVIPVGTKVQSLPGPDEKPQTFETVSALTARVGWNAMKPRSTQNRDPGFGDVEVTFQGANLNLQIGDMLLFVGGENRRDITAEQWDIRKITTVSIDSKAGTTHVTWGKGLGHLKKGRRTSPAASDPQVFVFRQKANAFGFNAQPFDTVPDATKRDAYGLGSEAGVDAKNQWPGFDLFRDRSHALNLDQFYPKILKDSFLVLMGPGSGSKEGYRELFQVASVSESAQAKFGISSKTTLLSLEGENFAEFQKLRREVAVFAAPELLSLAPAPWLNGETGNPAASPWKLAKTMACPVAGAKLQLALPAPVMAAGHKLLIVGKAVRLSPTTAGLQIDPGGGLSRRALAIDETVITETLPVSHGSNQWQLQARTLDGFKGSLTFRTNQVVLMPADAADPDVAEAVLLDGPVPDGVETVTSLQFTTATTRFYDRLTVSLSANVAPATHGETVKEVLGSGDAAAAFQRMKLKQTPLTYVPVSTGTGAESSLEIRVGGVLWQEASTLLDPAADATVFITEQSDATDESKVAVTFGDGMNGSRLPTGTANIEATYRKGIGLVGEVAANQLTQLLTRPLGVKSVVNPIAPSGAADPESSEEVRAHAPKSVQTLARIVSLSDYEAFAATFAGIGKAKADWLWNGEQKLVHVTVASASGQSPAAGSDLVLNLTAAMNGARDMRQIVRVTGYSPLTFKVSARLLVDSRYVAADVFAAAQAALSERFGFQRRRLNQGLRGSEVIAVLQAVAGVLAVDLDALHLSGTPASLSKQIIAHAARWSADEGSSLLPAELLTLAPRGASFQEMAA